MLDHRRQRHRQRRGELAHRERALGQARDQRPPRRVGQSGEGAVEAGGRIVNHVVKYSPGGGGVKPGAGLKPDVKAKDNPKTTRDEGLDRALHVLATEVR